MADQLTIKKRPDENMSVFAGPYVREKYV